MSFFPSVIIQMAWMPENFSLSHLFQIPKRLITRSSYVQQVWKNVIFELQSKKYVTGCSLMKKTYYHAFGFVFSNLGTWAWLSHLSFFLPQIIRGNGFFSTNVQHLGTVFFLCISLFRCDALLQKHVTSILSQGFPVEEIRWVFFCSAFSAECAIDWWKLNAAVSS